ncbi:amino acid ABC transporter permease [Donghicola tyrosinivorans]|uniref:General L-amino acid transport system permease protein n=1 Tax=Donghicola tyrosinivorans TaxID=1652492 RepID=A0A2T0W8P6_9RHOB|nr:ABC transporter permease subunit [Donghicola tyrosinivorans]PRY83082.1 general L-amino acid transport system permease protein [Donghicola tyrosinivorans]
MVALLKNRHVRDNALQVLFVGSIVSVLALLAITAKTNMDAQGITGGFAFLERATGWRVGFSLIETDASLTYAQAILIGITNSLFLGAITLPLASLVGVTVGVMRTSGNGMAELLGTTYVETFRNIPLILQLLFWYTIMLALPSPRDAEPLIGSVVLTGRGIYIPGLNVTGGSVFAGFVWVALMMAVVVRMTPRRWRNIDTTRARHEKRVVWLLALAGFIAALWIGRIPDTPLASIPEAKGLNFKGGIRISPELIACVLAISIYGGAYIAEIIRAGFNAIPKGQSEAGKALGLSGWHIFSRIRLPLAIRIVMPTLINQYVWLFKATTIGIAVSFTDFFMVISTAINQAGQTMELIFMLMAGFLIINYSIAWVLNRVNDAIKLKGTQLRI